MTAGIENLRRLGLTVEATAHLGLESLLPFADLLVSAHAPYLSSGLRINIAATDAEHRKRGIDELVGYVDMVRRLPGIKQVNMHPAPRQWLDPSQTTGRHGDYDLLIDGIQRIAGYAAKFGIEIVLENNNSNWTGIGDDVPADQVDRTDKNQAFGSAPEEWIQVCEDVGRPNVMLCLDTSHACTYAQTISEPERRSEAIMGFLARPELIRHVHWNDNYLYDARGRKDSHASLGKGSLPVELHRTIKGLDATLLLEHFYTVEDLEEEIEFIDGL